MSMVHASQRAAVGGPALPRLLARLAQLDASAPGTSLSDRLSQWLAWTDAIVLSSTLNAASPAGGGERALDADADAATALSKRIRADLEGAIARACVQPAQTSRPAHAARGGSAAPTQQPALPPQRTASDDYAPLRQRYTAVQQTMETDIGKLRARLRAMLGAKTAELGRLAALDAVMERAMSVREHNLLAAAPTLLERHFTRLREAAAAPSPGDALSTDDATLPAPAGNDAWSAQFRHDMRTLLLAELDFRFQPVAGLLTALRTR